MASMSPEEKVQFLLHVIANSEFKPDYQAVAISLGINTSSNAQRRFKSIVEADKNFILNSTKDNVKVMYNGIPTTANSENQASSKKTARKPRKRKHEDEDDANGQSTKNTRKEGGYSDMTDEAVNEDDDTQA